MAAKAGVQAGWEVSSAAGKDLTPLIAHRFGWTGGLSFASLVVVLGMLAWLVIDPTHQVRYTSDTV